MEFDIDLIADIIVDAIPPGAEFDDVARDEARRVVQASVMGLMEDEFCTYYVVQHLGELTNGYGCWLDWIDSAFIVGFSNLPSEYGEWEKGRIEGSYQMVKRIIFELVKHRYGKGQPFQFDVDD